MARLIASPRTITVLLKVDDEGCPRSPQSNWTRHLGRQEELRARRPIEDVEWRTGGFSTLKPGDRIFILASHPDQAATPNARRQRAIIGYGEATGPSYVRDDGNHVLLRLHVALKPDQALRKRDVEEILPGVILWDKPNGKDITKFHDKMNVIFHRHLADIDFFR